MYFVLRTLPYIMETHECVNREERTKAYEKSIVVCCASFSSEMLLLLPCLPQEGTYATVGIRGAPHFSEALNLRRSTPLAKQMVLRKVHASSDGKPQGLRHTPSPR